MGKCIDCETELQSENRSPHQPTIRCRSCFDVFSDGVEAVLTGKSESTQEFIRKANVGVSIERESSNEV